MRAPGRPVMLRTMLKSKIHRATVTQSDLHYVGSVTVDQDLMEAADLLEGERVAIVDITNGARLETYVIPGERGSGVIGINGAAARLVHPGDLVILISYGVMDEADAIGPDGQFLGGALAPGVEVSLDALATRAAQLRSVELTCPPQAIGKNTVAALQSGLVLGFAGLVDGLVSRIAAELVDQFGTAPVVVATGGLHGVVVDSCRSIGQREPDLTVHGLRLAFERQQPGDRHPSTRRTASP